MSTELFKILSDPTRLRILVLLYHHDLCVCEMVTLLEESQPKISKHIAKIRAMQFVLTNRNEQYVYYSLNRSESLLVNMLETLMQSVVNTEPYKLDLERLNNQNEFVCERN
jgi:ArsR family transcriptional regulator